MDGVHSRPVHRRAAVGSPTYDAGMEFTDWISVAAVIVSTVALIVAGVAAYYAKRQADATEEANRLRVGQRWRVVEHTLTQWKLLNVSQFVATEVEIDLSRIECHVAGQPEKATIGVGNEGHVFTMMGGTGQPPLPSHVYVRWAEGPRRKGRPEWVAVPLEPRVRPLVTRGRPR